MCTDVKLSESLCKVQGQINQICPLYPFTKKITIFVMLIARNIKIIPIDQEYARRDWDANILNEKDI